MNQPARKTEILSIAAIFLLALGVRSLPSYDMVFPEGEPVAFIGSDSYFHMRTVDNLVAHFPHRSGFDPYMVYPGGQNIPTGPFFDWLIAGVAWTLGLGTPSEGLVDAVGAWTPAVLGALAAVGVWLIGRILFGPGAALAGAAIFALLPGTLYELSRIGFPDHHVAEVALFAALWPLLQRAIAAPTAARRWGFTAAAGIAMGAFLLNRPAAAFLAAPLALWGAWECLRRVRTDRPPLEVAAVAATVLGVAAAVFIPGGGMIWSEVTLLALAGGGIGVLAVGVAAWMWRRLSWPATLFPLALLAAAAGGFLIARTAAPDAVRTLFENVHRVSTARSTLTVRELMPLLLDMRTGGYSLRPGYEHFGFAFFLFPFAALWALRRSLRDHDPNLSLLVVLSGFFFALTLLQSRMSVYLAPCLAATVGAALWELYRLGGRFPRLAAAASLAAILGSSGTLLARDARIQTGPNADWRKTLDWMRANTPEPFGDPAVYFQRHPRLAPGESFDYPPSVYSVMLWWDYGYWLERSARRIPVANGTQTGARFAARYFTETDPEAAAAMMAESKSRYVVVDPNLPMWRHEQLTPFNAKVRSMFVWSERDPQDYASFRIQFSKGAPRIVTLFTPDYYKMMLTRLFAFDGGAFEPRNSSWVVSFQNLEGEDGPYQRVSSMVAFETYEEAQRYLDLRPDQDLMLAGLDPRKSPVPIEALGTYRPVFESNEDALPGLTGRYPIKVFEYDPNGFGPAADGE